MKESKLGKLIDGITSFADTHQREILLGCTIVGVISTGIAAWKNSPKAHKIVRKHRKAMGLIDKDLENGDISEEEAKNYKKEETVLMIKEVTPLVLPPVVLGGATIAAAIGGNSASSKRIAALSAAYNLANEQLEDLTDKTEEILGVKKAQEIKDAANVEKMNRDYEKTKNSEIIETGNGNTLFYDKYCGRFFRSSWEAVKSSVNQINRECNDSCYGGEVKYNDLADLYGLPDDSVFGDMMVFKKEKGRNVTQIDLITSSSHLETKIYPGTMESATIIDYRNRVVMSEEYTKI